MTTAMTDLDGTGYHITEETLSRLRGTEFMLNVTRRYLRDNIIKRADLTPQPFDASTERDTAGLMFYLGDSVYVDVFFKADINDNGEVLMYANQPVEYATRTSHVAVLVSGRPSSPRAVIVRDKLTHGRGDALQVRETAFARNVLGYTGSKLLVYDYTNDAPLPDVLSEIKARRRKRT